MARSVAEIVAANEAAFREVNEAIERGQWPGEEDRPAAFRCECARPGCNKLVRMTPREYERVRADPRRFLIVAGHEVPEVERVVETMPGHSVVEKFGQGGEIAEATDPRS